MILGLVVKTARHTRVQELSRAQLVINDGAACVCGGRLSEPACRDRKRYKSATPGEAFIIILRRAI